MGYTVLISWYPEGQSIPLGPAQEHVWDCFILLPMHSFMIFSEIDEVTVMCRAQMGYENQYGAGYTWIPTCPVSPA